MKASQNPADEIRHLFQKHVPEVASGVVELVSIAREVGDRVIVAVRSHDSSIHPVSACVGKHGTHPKNIMRELGGEKVIIVLWSESPERFLLNVVAIFNPAAGRRRTPKVTLDAATHIAQVEVTPETLAYLSEQGEARVRLVSRLVGWDIHLLSHDHN